MITLLIIYYFFGSSALDGEAGVYVSTVLVAVVASIWYFRRRSKLKRLKGLKELPGPRGLPIVGNLHQLGGHPSRQMSKWADKYGDIYQVKLGNLTSVVLSDAKICKEIFSGDPAMSGRPHIPALDMYEDAAGRGLGIFNSEGDRWEVHRRFLLRQLRDFGFGKSSMEALIMDEVTEVIESYKKKAGKPTEGIRETLRLAVVNSLWTLMSSQRFPHDDIRLLNLANNTSKKFNEVTEKGGLLIFLPWLKNIIPEASGYNGIREVLSDNRDMFEMAIEEHKSTFREDHLRDYIDLYLAEMKKAENDPTSQFHGETAQRHLVVILFDLFFAGSDSTSMTTAWACLYLCMWPHVQENLQKEIDEITGSIRRVSVGDRPNMPYASALVDEIFRYSSIVPSGAAHRAMTDREFRGYLIPKDALIQPNIRYMHFNPKVWGDPENFRPERFLSQDGKKYIKSEHIQPFQIGSRQCLGETLARDTVFLYVTNLFQQFRMEFEPKEETIPSLEPEPGLLAAPRPFSVIMTDRLDGRL